MYISVIHKFSEHRIVTPQSEKKPNINHWGTFLTEGAQRLPFLLPSLFCPRRQGDKYYPGVSFVSLLVISVSVLLPSYMLKYLL